MTSRISGAGVRSVAKDLWTDVRYFFHALPSASGNFWYIAGRWQEEPIGVLTPLIALLAVLLAPQMPDMFAGIAGGFLSGGAALYALAAAALGFSAWYWTRAALAARFREDDFTRYTEEKRRLQKQKSSKSQRQEHDPVREAREHAPRIGLVFALIVALAPIINASSVNSQVPWAGSILGAILVMAVYLFVRYRKQIVLGRDWVLHARSEPVRLWRAADWPVIGWPLAVIAAGPFGWPVAAGMILISLGGIALVAVAPGCVEQINAPAAALFALALVIPPLVLALAVVRDLIYGAILPPLAGGMRVIGGLLRSLGVVSATAGTLPAPAGRSGEGREAAPSPGTLRRSSDRMRWSSRFGLIALGLLIFGPSVSGYGKQLYAVRMTADRGEAPLRSSGYTDANPPAGVETAHLAHSPLLERPSIREALHTWRAEQIAAGHPAGHALPLIIVAAEGGASRAAVWLLSAMRLLDAQTEGRFGRALFAIVGVSGGSLGAATYLQAAVRHGTEDGGLPWDHVKAGLDAMGRADLLAASIASYFLNDTLGALLAPAWVWLAVPDRAEALEGAFERHWQRHWLGNDDTATQQARQGFIAVRAGKPRLAHLMLLGTDVETGRRLITASIRFDPEDDLFAGADDLLAILGHDVPLATAVTNSARFPFISPAGVFHDSFSSKDRQIVDGGYFENYGARTAAELSQAVTRISDQENWRLVPIVVVVSNDGDGVRDEAELREEKERSKRCEEDNRAHPQQAGRPCPAVPPLLDEVSITCDSQRLLAPETARQRSGAGQGVVPEALAPVLGLYATRSAHGQDALHMVRRLHCPASGSVGDKASTAALKRMIHIALPRADTKKKEAAPLNWVLNENVRQFLVDSAPEAAFNACQARTLAATLDHLSAPGHAGGERP